MVVVEIEQLVGEAVKRGPNVVKPGRQFLVNIIQLAAPGRGMGSDKLEIGPPDFFIELEVGRPAPAAALGVLMENTTDEERIVADVRAQQKTFLGAGLGERDQHVGKILA